MLESLPVNKILSKYSNSTSTSFTKASGSVTSCCHSRMWRLFRWMR